MVTANPSHALALDPSAIFLPAVEGCETAMPPSTVHHDYSLHPDLAPEVYSLVVYACVDVDHGGLPDHHGVAVAVPEVCVAKSDVLVWGWKGGDRSVHRGTK